MITMMVHVTIIQVNLSFSVVVDVDVMNILHVVLNVQIVRRDVEFRSIRQEIDRLCE
jgi:hypothetical protein